MKHLAILGSTGSIGTQTLDIVRNNRDRFKVVSLAARSSIDLLEKQIREFEPLAAAVWDEEKASNLAKRVSDTSVKILSGMEGLIEASRLAEADMTVTAIVGMIGIRPTVAAIKAGKDIALANKETLVTAGHIIMPLAKKHGVSILPVDSEHSAIFQSLQGNSMNPIEKIILTASGGPFRGKTLAELENVTVDDALKHPNWSMGPKITIDSATMVNKGLEVMEASRLFDVPAEKIEVHVHPQSIVHSAVQYADGAVMAQLGTPDMHIPIAYALNYPERLTLPEERLDLFKIHDLTFEKPDLETFKGLKMAYRAISEGGIMPTVFNAANEKAVAMFLDRRIKYLEIPEIIEYCLDNSKQIEDPALEDIFNAEAETYRLIERW